MCTQWVGNVFKIFTALDVMVAVRRDVVVTLMEIYSPMQPKNSFDLKMLHSPIGSPMYDSKPDVMLSVKLPDIIATGKLYFPTSRICSYGERNSSVHIVCASSKINLAIAPIPDSLESVPS
ncbi:hypothetical protein ACA910_015328 [Epithemia clementina (nom. ined.)]